MIVSDTHRLIVCPWCGRELPVKLALSKLTKHTRPERETACAGSGRDPRKRVADLLHKLRIARQRLRRMTNRCSKLRAERY